MRWHWGRFGLRRFGSVAVALLLTFGIAPPVAEAGVAITVADGVTYYRLKKSTPAGRIVVHMLKVNLSRSSVRMDLLSPSVVTARAPLSGLARAARAVGGINGDFFHISDTHGSVAPTFAPVGPEVSRGRDRKAAVPDGQRFGPRMAKGTSTRDVFAQGIDGRLRVASLRLVGAVVSAKGIIELDGLNQYALPQNGVGLFTSAWGSAPRVRAVCGSNRSRYAPCSKGTEEVVVRDGVVVAEHNRPGSGRIARDTVVLVGRDRGNTALETLNTGDVVRVQHKLLTEDGVPVRFAIGGAPMLRDGTALRGLNPLLAPRTGAGTSADGRTGYLVVVDGRSSRSVGISVGGLAQLMKSLGADDAVNLDGGGSSTLVTRAPSKRRATVRNAPSDGVERLVPNGIGVFVNR